MLVADLGEDDMLGGASCRGVGPEGVGAVGLAQHAPQGRRAGGGIHRPLQQPSCVPAARDTGAASIRPALT